MAEYPKNWRSFISRISSFMDVWIDVSVTKRWVLLIDLTQFQMVANVFALELWPGLKLIIANAIYDIAF